jgi:L-amino acid N-acyltransferase YncA
MTERHHADYRLVPLSEHHVAAMLRIFNQHVAEGFAAYPEEPVSEEIMHNLLSQVAVLPAIAVETADGTLLGFGFLRSYSPQTAFAHTAQITIFLNAQHTRAGIGTAVLRHLEDNARRQGITKILAHISSRNAASLAFHTKHGFTECGRFPEIGRKWEVPFDVVWMIKSL